jgi:hypothetical protein
MKYGNKRTKVNGITFASKKEANRYLFLLSKQNSGEISELELQPEYKLWVTSEDGFETMVGRYRGDFRYLRGGKRIVEDVKGYKTPIYRLKKKMVEARYGIRILET